MSDEKGFQNEVEGLMKSANSMIQNGMYIFKKMGAQVVEDGYLSQAEWNESVKDLDLMLAMKMDPKRQTEAVALEKRIMKKMQDMMNSKKEEE